MRVWCPLAGFSRVTAIERTRLRIRLILHPFWSKPCKPILFAFTGHALLPTAPLTRTRMSVTPPIKV